MRWWRRLLSPTYRRARRAEAGGEYRRAAALYVEAGAHQEAADALVFLAARLAEPGQRRDALEDALRWLGDGHPRRLEVEVRLARLILAEAREGGGGSARADLERAARWLEGAGRHPEAATAWELLGRDQDAARCLTEAGELERLEAVLARVEGRERHDRRVRAALARYRMGMDSGARDLARQALRQAMAEVPDVPEVTELLRRLEGSWLESDRVELRWRDRRWLVVGHLPVTLGRVDADVPLRGGSVSRRHAEVERVGPDQARIRDLGSKNGTLLGGVPIAEEATVRLPVEVGLGEDLDIRVAPGEPAGLHLELVRGLDRGLVILAGESVQLPGAAASVGFPGGQPTLRAHAGAELRLGATRCVAPVVLLRGDRLVVDGEWLEVVS